MEQQSAAPAGAGKEKKSGGGLGWALLAVVLAFGGGAGWQYYRVLDVQEMLDQARAELRVERLRLGLAQAAMAAQAGEFEPARLRMSTFFTQLDESIAELPDAVAAVGDDFLSSRDEVITALSRANPEYPAILWSMLDRFETAMGSPPERLAPPAADTGM